MAEGAEDPIYWTLFLRYSGLLLFIITVVTLNILTRFLPDPRFLQVVTFLNTTIGLLFTASILFFAGSVFRLLAFPLNLPAPVFSATGSIILLTFLFSVFQLAGEITGVVIDPVMQEISVTAILVVFVVVLAIGYVDILWPFFSPGSRASEACRLSLRIPHGAAKEITWEMVEAEFRYALYDILRKIREKLGSRQK
ncbi:MAG: hypothetical protein KO206_05400 [Methanomicrobiaceae archaeon]|nr:hypothetical protein [Methanomicrobiaceae archaeon]MDD5418760.1 hypothetical protein [Methanomicrobiaceae archaeon]